jgi:hypothetical protein
MPVSRPKFLSSHLVASIKLELIGQMIEKIIISDGTNTLFTKKIPLLGNRCD